MSTNFSYCGCNHCDKIIQNSQNGIWIHSGIGTMSNDDFKNVPDGTCIENFFEQPIKRSKYKSFYGRFNTKPKNVIWFSNGTWLFDSYCEGHDNVELCKRKVVIIKEPKNILSISTIKELDNFVDKYGENMYEFLSTYKIIRWDKIYDEGYYGVAFNFRKINHVDPNITYIGENMKYFWHCGFDVETLCIFDTRAFDDQVIIDTIEI